MKKFILFLLLIFPFSSFAVENTYTLPTFADISSTAITGDCGGNCDAPVGTNKIYDVNFNGTIHPEQYCIERGETYVSHTSSDSNGLLERVAYFRATASYWSQTNGNFTYALTIVCDDGIPEPPEEEEESGTGSTSTGSTVVYNTVNNETNYDGGIGEDIFSYEWTYEFFQMFFTALLFWALITILFKFNMSTRRPKRFKFSNIFK